MQYLESDGSNFEIYSVTDRKPVEISKNRRNMANAKFLGNQSINQSIFISRRMTGIQITFAFKIFKINHKLNKLYAKKRKINK